MSKPTRVPITYFAPAERVSIRIVRRQAAAFAQPPLTDELLNSTGTSVLIVNAQRQIVFASRGLRGLLPAKTRARVLGLRLGEALGCVYAKETAGGCGTSKFCAKCGALQAMMSSLTGHADSKEYRLARLINCGEEALHFLVLSKPLTHRRQRFSVLALTDGADPKARDTLRRHFSEEAAKSIEGGSQLRSIPKPSPATKRPPRPSATRPPRGTKRRGS